MSGYIDLEEMKQILSHSMIDCGMELVNLVDCDFKFLGNADPVLVNNGIEYIIKSEWVITQLCRLLGVNKKFWDRNPDELSEEIFKVHFNKIEDDSCEVSLLFKSEGPQNVLRGIVPKDHFVMSNLELLGVLEEHIGTSEIKEVFFVEGSGAYDNKFISAVVTNKEYILSGRNYNYAIMTLASEVGAPDLSVVPILLDLEKKNFFPLLVNSKIYTKHKYLAPKNGTIVPDLIQSLEGIEEILECVVDDLKDKLLEEITYEEMLKTISDWSTRKGFTEALSKKLSSNLTSLVRENDDDEDAEGYNFETVGDLVNLTFETIASDKFEPFLRGALFLSERMGFNYIASR